MKLATENIDDALPSENYYDSSEEFAEPETDEFDAELLERFLQMLDEAPDTPSGGGYDNYDDLPPQLYTSEQTKNTSGRL